MRAFPLCLVAGLLCSATLLPAAAPDKRNQANTQAKAGVVTREITPTARRNWRGTQDHTLHVTVWYPATESATETPQSIGPPDAPLFQAGSAVPHAAFAPSLSPFPLVLLSHGTGGSALQLAWLGTALARAGFLAAAVDHPGNNAVTGTTAEGFLLPWERTTDLSEVLDGLLADPELGPHIDRDHIGAAGFSIGGYTALALAGARVDLSLVVDLCRKDPATPGCTVAEMGKAPDLPHMLESVRKTSGESLARSGDSFRDPRIRAVFALAPALGFAQTPESLRAVRLPVQLVVGAADPIAPATLNADRYKGGIRGAREVVLPNVAHYTFLDTCAPAGKASLASYCTDPPGTDREAVHAQVAEMAVQFFSKTL